MPWDFALILVVLGVVVPWRGAVRVRHLMRQPDLTTADRLALYASTIAFQSFAAGIVFWRCVVHHVSTVHLALSRGTDAQRTVLVAVLLTALLAATQIISIRRLAKLPASKQGFFRELQLKLMPHTATEQLAFLALVTIAAVCEEFLYRGFVQAVFQDLALGSAILGALASAAFFAGAHLYQGRRGLAATFTVGFLFSLVRMATTSLLPAMLAHFVTDLLAGLLAPAILERTATAARETRENSSTR